MPQLDITAFPPQIIWLIITFLILYAVMAKVALPRIGNILEQRQARIDDNLDVAQSLRRESSTNVEYYDQVMAGAREKARQTIQDTTKELSNAAVKRQEKLGVRLSDELKAAEDRISEAKAAAIKSIHESAASITSEAIEILIAEKPEKTAVKTAISLALKESNREIKT